MENSRNPHKPTPPTLFPRLESPKRLHTRILLFAKKKKNWAITLTTRQIFHLWSCHLAGFLCLVSWLGYQSGYDAVYLPSRLASCCSWHNARPSHEHGGGSSDTWPSSWWYRRGLGPGKGERGHTGHIPYPWSWEGGQRRHHKPRRPHHHPWRVPKSCSHLRDDWGRAPKRRISPLNFCPGGGAQRVEGEGYHSRMSWQELWRHWRGWWGSLFSIEMGKKGIGLKQDLHQTKRQLENVSLKGEISKAIPEAVGTPAPRV